MENFAHIALNNEQTLVNLPEKFWDIGLPVFTVWTAVREVRDTIKNTVTAASFLSSPIDLCFFDLTPCIRRIWQ